MKRILMAATAVALLLVSAWFVSAAGTYDLSWFTIDGGGGSSGGGSYSLSGTIGQPDVGNMQGGSFGLEGGFWGGVCTFPAAPDAAIAAAGGQVQLSWTAVAGAAGYSVYRAANDPAFAPGAPYATAATSPWLDPDPSAIGDPATNYYYVVRAANACGESGDSQQLGAFDFAIQPGT